VPRFIAPCIASETLAFAIVSIENPMRRQDEIALSNRSLVSFASAVDAILRAFTFGWPQAAADRDIDEMIAGLCDLEPVREFFIASFLAPRSA
jgi:hypothetical protein